MGTLRRAVAATLAFTLAGCDVIDGCVNTPLLTAPSPDGERVAVAFERSCGATTGFSTHLSILPATEPVPSDGGNVAVARELFPFSLHWRDSGQLRVTFLAAGVVRSQEMVDDVRIDYVRAPPDPTSPHTWSPHWPQPLLPEKTNQKLPN